MPKVLELLVIVETEDEPGDVIGALLHYLDIMPEVRRTVMVDKLASHPEGSTSSRCTQRGGTTDC